jgi:hypothetical protein
MVFCQLSIHLKASANTCYNLSAEPLLIALPSFGGTPNAPAYAFAKKDGSSIAKVECCGDKLNNQYLCHHVLSFSGDATSRNVDDCRSINQEKPWRRMDD